MRNMNRLTPFARVAIFIVIIGCVGAVLYFTGMFSRSPEEGDSNEPERQQTEGHPNDTESNNTSTSTNVPSVTQTVDTIRISLDEWVGWKPLLDAAGGLTTQPGSIYDRLGLNVEFVIINDADHSSSALISGSIHGAGYTINRYAFLYQQFIENGLNPAYIFTLYTSSGGDGVIASTNFTNIEALHGARIGVPRFSEAMALMDWLINQTSLTDQEKENMKNNMVMFDTPDDAARAFFAGRLDAAATWQPYLSQAQETANTHLLFSTTHATNLIVGGLIFDYDFIEANEGALVKLAQGMIEAYDMYLTDMGSIRTAMPMFSLESDASIIEMAQDATLFSARNMIDHMQGTAQMLFADMADVWAARGERAGREDADAAFTDRIVNRLDRDTGAGESTLVEHVFTEEIREVAKEAIRESRDTSALFTMRADIRFEPNTAVILEESYPEMDRFFSSAMLLDGAIILVEGNIANVQGHAESTAAGLQLSEERARAVARYLQLRGVDSNRFIIVGNGIDRQIASNDTEEGRMMNRRTDVSFMIVE